MRERPIIFNSEMVRAVMEGRKVQTRRIIKNQPFDRSWSRHDHQIEIASGRAVNGDEIDGLLAYTKSSGGEWHSFCPFGQPGDRLWVRESCFAEHGARTSVDSGSKLVYFPADMGSFEASPDQEILWEKLWCYGKGAGGQVVPSIHMPRWASRITLEITGVRVERLQDISEEDAAAEGAPTECCVIGDKHFLGFRSLWRSIYGEESWQANPWVWVIEFKRVEGE